MSKANELLEATKIDPELIRLGKEQMVELWKIENGKLIKKDVGYAKFAPQYGMRGYIVVFPLKKKQSDELKSL